MSSTTGDRYEDPGVMEVTGKVLIATIIALFFVLILVFLFHIYARWLWHRRQQTLDSNNPNRRRQGQHSGVTVLRRGLDEAFLKTLPITLHDSSNNEPLECSVCLSEVEQGDKIRLLPKCNHTFHAECIDMWFHSHSTCPICRNSVSEQTQQVSVESLLENNTQEEQQRMSTDSHTSNFPANVLFWGDETEVSTLTSQLQELDQPNNNHQQRPAQTVSLDKPTTSSSSNNDRLKPDLVIDIPRQVNEDEDEKTPISSRMRSLRRILSSTSRRFNPFSPQPAAAANNIEQASRS